MCTLGQSVKTTHNQQNPHNNLNKISKSHIQTSYSQISSKTHNLRTLRQEMWNTLRKKQNPYLFLNIGEEMRENMEVLCVNTMILKEGRTDKTMNSHEMWGKTEIFLKTALKISLIMQNTCFLRLDWVANESPKQVAKNLCDKFFRIYLSVFRDWKVYSRARHDWSCQTFWVNLATEASTREPVAKLSRENPKNPDFQNFSKSFSRLWAWPARKLPRAAV